MHGDLLDTDLCRALVVRLYLANSSRHIGVFVPLAQRADKAPRELPEIDFIASAGSAAARIFYVLYGKTAV